MDWVYLFMSKPFDFSGNTALVTGGSLGIGRAIVEVFSAFGINTYFTYNKSLEKAKELEKKTGAIGFKVDFSKKNELANFVKIFKKEVKALNFLIHNAGIWDYFEIGKTDFKVWENLIQINLNSIGYLTNELIDLMLESANSSIVLVSSTAGRRGESYHSHYSATKSALLGLAKSWAVEFGPKGIRTNAVAPGWVNTPMSEEALKDEKFKKELIKKIPLRRIPEPEDIAYPVLFLVSNWAKHINGAVLDVNGGAVLMEG